METGIENYYTWGFDSAAIFFRYFFLAGIGYLIFYVWKEKMFSAIKIQQKDPASKNISREIFYSVSTLTIYCGASWLTIWFYKHGLTKIYIDIHQYGYFYFAASIVFMILLHDAYFYWTHRWMHHPKIFKYVHRVHHLSLNPTPWAAFSFHPWEAIISVGIIPIIVFLIPAHPFAIFTFLTYMTLVNVMGHLGYETFPEKFIGSKVGKWQNTATWHNIHHQRSGCNYGLYFTFWDRIMNTYNEHNPRK